MCGGCARGDAGDWVTRAVPDRAARARAAGEVNRLSSGVRLEVDAAASGFTVRHLTGRTVVAPTLSAVWDAVLAAGGTPVVVPVPVAAGGQRRRETAVGGAPGDAPPAPGCRLVLLVDESPAAGADEDGRVASSAQVVSAWAPDLVVDADASHQSRADDLAVALADALEPGLQRVLLRASAAAADLALAAVAMADVRLRASVTAVVTVAEEAPRWATSLTGMTEEGVRHLLDGGVAQIERRPDLGLAEAAAWMSGLVRSGATAGRRRTVAVAGGHWLLDAANGHGLAVRHVRQHAD